MKFLSQVRLDNDATWIDSITGCRKNNLAQFNRLKPLIIDVYPTYDTLISNYEDSIANGIFHQDDQEADNPRKDLMIDYYEHPPKKLSELISKRRKEHGLNECPYCGNPKSPDTLDHFIPKGKWSEFSIYPNNLVPQCRECAPIKSEKYYSEIQSSAIYIHPFYYDLLSNIGFKISVTLQNSKFNYDVSFKMRREFNDREQSRIILHLEELDVKNRIIKYCRNETSHWIRVQKAYINDAVASFNMRINENGGAVHDNWKVALYKGYVSNHHVINYFNSLCPRTEVVVPPDVDFGSVDF